MQIHVVGIGNEWAGDDGVGPVIVRRIQAAYERRYQQNLPQPVTFTTLAGLPLDLLESSQPDDVLIIVDAVISGAPPGTIHQVDWQPGCLEAQGQERASSHGLGVRESLELAAALNWLPAQVILWGVEIASTAPGTGLTSIGQPAITGIVERLLDRLAEYQREHQ